MTPTASPTPEQLESLIALNRALVVQQLLRGLAHDLRNHLQVVALGSGLGDEARGTAIGIRVERSLDGMVAGLDTLSRLGKMGTEEMTRTDLGETMAATRELAALQRSVPALRLAVEPPPATTLVAIPRADLLLVLLNLVTNAKEAGLRPTDAVELVATLPMDGRIAILVDDSGAGMPPDAGAFFFTTKDRRTHGGLGLAVSRALVTRAGGELLWEPGPTGGTRVRLVVPLAGDG